MKPDTDDRPTPPAPSIDRAPQVIDLDAHRVKYDTESIQRFLETVFWGDHAERLCWIVRAVPSYPITPDDLTNRLKRSSAPRALYYGTSSCRRHEDGRLYNRGALFERLHVVVLDDLGTKVSLEKLPAQLRDEPSYVLETSPGNFQYGYVLSEPVTVLSQARALVQLVYDSGYTDAGGAMPTKLVRLPGGVNAKPGPNAMHPVTLHSLTERRWGAQELLSAVGSTQTWEAVQRDATAALKRPGATSVTPWSPTPLVSPNLDGGVDPVLEWLYAKQMVYQEVNDWVTIPCPNAHMHTTGDNTAGYSPLGRGDGKYANYRGFHCFHEHCKVFDSGWFLGWVASEGGPEAAVRDESTHLLREWVYDPTDDLAYKIYGTRLSGGIGLTALRSMFRKKIHIAGADGKIKRISEVDNWLNANKVMVNGSVLNPTTRAPLVEYPGEFPRINVFSRPDWGEGEWFDDDVEMFEGFLRYLIPCQEEREHFLDWLAAKMQNMGFRGTGILMVAKNHGTGRGTLANIISTLMGQHNVVVMPFDKLIGRNEFNDWQRAPLVITNETLDVSDKHTFYRAYERLKGLIETQPTEVYINRKNRQAYTEIVYTSYLMFSNHENALALPDNDRRVYVINNALAPAGRDYFKRLYEWKDEIDPETGRPAWAPSIARWLMARKVDIPTLIADVPLTQGKETMLRATRSPMDGVVQALLMHWIGEFLSIPTAFQVVERVAHRIGLDGHPRLNAMLRASLRPYIVALPRSARCRLKDKSQVRPVVIGQRVSRDDLAHMLDHPELLTPSVLASSIEQNDVGKLTSQVLDDLSLFDL